ncbi:MAG: S41 family peptidase [Candidatus Eremiobacteraeota bacterium]|nr:S41 family peptidase [Candidatus Eremiobacteraeota bacterium]
MKTCISCLSVAMLVLAVVLLWTAPCGAEETTFSDLEKEIEVLSTRYIDPVSATALLKSFIEGACAELTAHKLPTKDLSYFPLTSTLKEDLKGIEKIIDETLPPGGSLPKAKLIEKGMEAVASSLKDENTRFYLPGSYHVKELPPARRGGIGLLIDESKDREGAFVITETYTGLPAEKAGLRTGDRIVEVDARDVKPLERHQLGELVSGEVGTPLILTVKQGAELRKVTLERVAMGTTDSVIYKPLAEKIGYLKFKLFNEGLEQATLDIVNTLRDTKMEGLIVDLRNNGGIPDAAISLTGLFIPKEDTIATQVFRNSKKIYVPKIATSYSLPTVVLVNEYSASASTLMAEAFRSSLKARIVGMPTEWRYSATSRLELKSGATLVFTTSYYILSNGKAVRGKGEGVKPGILVPQEPRDTSALDQEKDEQLKRAVELLQEALKSKTPMPPQ